MKHTCEYTMLPYCIASVGRYSSNVNVKTHEGKRGYVQESDSFIESLLASQTKKATKSLAAKKSTSEPKLHIRSLTGLC